MNIRVSNWNVKYNKRSKTFWTFWRIWLRLKLTWCHSFTCDYQEKLHVNMPMYEMIVNLQKIKFFIKIPWANSFCRMEVNEVMAPILENYVWVFERNQSITLGDSSTFYSILFSSHTHNDIILLCLLWLKIFPVLFLIDISFSFFYLSAIFFLLYIIVITIYYYLLPNSLYSDMHVIIPTKCISTSFWCFMDFTLSH